MLNDKYFILLQRLLPQALLSRLIGKIANSNNSFIKNYLINLAIRKFKIDLSDSVGETPDFYSSFNDFFTRKLKQNARIIDADKSSIISPADGTIVQYGPIKHDTLIQAKQKTFTARALLAAEKPNFTDFAIIYLAPKDYHRVHMPLDGRLTKMTYIPGRLFSVNATTSKHIEQLFAKNERVVCYFDTIIGEVAIVLVGALFVASIVTKWHHTVAPNYITKLHTWEYHDQNITFKKGDEIGYFNFGSTVICLFPHNKVTLAPANNTIQMGNVLGKMNPSVMADRL